MQRVQGAVMRLNGYQPGQAGGGVRMREDGDGGRRETGVKEEGLDDSDPD